MQCIAVQSAILQNFVPAHKTHTRLEKETGASRQINVHQHNDFENYISRYSTFSCFKLRKASILLYQDKKLPNQQQQCKYTGKWLNDAAVLIMHMEYTEGRLDVLREEMLVDLK